MSEIFVSEKETVKKPKRKLTEKQKEALARGRAKAQEKRKQKKENDKLEKEAVQKKKEQRAVSKNLLKEQQLLEQVIIKEKHEKYRNEIEGRSKKWEEARIHALSKCKTKKQFEEVSKELDKVGFDDFKTEDGISKRFEKYFSKK